MIGTLTDFEDATSFERLALQSIFPAPVRMPGRPSLDLRANRIILYAEGFQGGEDRRAEVIHQLRPLLFGAAWKILDILVELALNQAGFNPKQKELRIVDKVTNARNASGILTPLSSDAEIWARLTRLYAQTDEARNCLVHRKFLVSTVGDLTSLRDRTGTSKPDVTVAEQEAFCRTARQAASCAIAQRFTHRDKVDLSWWLDQLTNHHTYSPLGKGGGNVKSIENVAVNADPSGTGWLLDLAAIKQKAASSFENRPYVDIEIHFPNTGLPPLRGRLEEAPTDPAFSLDLSALPGWIDP